MKRSLIGIVLLVLIVAAALLYQFVIRNGAPIRAAARPAAVTLRGYVGSEKAPFLENRKIKDILSRRYGISLDYSKAGSIEMVRLEGAEQADFLWPSSQVALELYRLLRGGASAKSEIIFNSPIVLYSWDRVTQALVSAGLVEARGPIYFLHDFRGLIETAQRGRSWSELGLEELYGRVSVVSTDPTKSNSGNMFAGLVANILHGEVVDETGIEPLLPALQEFFARMGYMEHSTGVLFDQYLQKGMGAYPLIVGYENQIVEFSLQHPDIWPRVQGRLRILYPEPTVWSSHPLIAVSARAGRLIEALKDDEIQRLAWEEHGFRTGVAGVQNDPKILKIDGVAESVTKIMPMPTPQVMDRIINALLGQ